MTQNDKNKIIEPTKQDHLLAQLRQYYQEVKTKRQLNFDVPAGFRKDTVLQRNLKEAIAAFPSPVDEFTPLPDNQTDLPEEFLTSSIHDDTISNTSKITHPIPLPDTTSSLRVPLIRCVDKPSSSLPSRITLNEDFIHASVGFRRIDTMKTYLSTLYHDTIKLDSSPSDAVLDRGDLATIRKSPQNTAPVPRPLSFDDVIHMDIVFAPEVALANTHYGLIFTDRYSQMTYMYPLQNLTTDIIKQLDCFFAHLGCLPKRLITDFDTKLIGGKARDHLNRLKIHVNTAAAFRQDKNGLAERHWQTLIAMARNWLLSAELPAKFWFFAVKRASEICNYFPLKLEDGTWTTPFTLAHGEKPDLRVLFKMFGLATVRRE